MRWYTFLHAILGLSFRTLAQWLLWLRLWIHQLLVHFMVAHTKTMFELSHSHLD